MHTRFLVAALAVALAPSSVHAQCLPRTGDVYLCDDLTTGRSSGRVMGGRLVAGTGFTVLTEGDLILYDLGRDYDTGTLRVVVTGVDDTRLHGDSYIFAMMHDHEGEPADPTGFALRLGGDLDGTNPEGLGTLKLEAWDTAGEAARFTSSLRWRPATVYVIDMEFSQRRAELAVIRDGVEIRRFSTSIPGPPAGDTVRLRYRYVHIPMPNIRGHVFDPVIGSSIRSVSLDATAIEEPDLGPAPPATDAGTSTGTGADAATAPDTGTASATDAATATATDAATATATDAATATATDAATDPATATDASRPRRRPTAKEPTSLGCSTSPSRPVTAATVTILAFALLTTHARFRRRP